MLDRSLKQDLVWLAMQMLDAIGLGDAVEVSKVRDKFVLNSGHRAATLLTDRPKADGFIRSDKDSLLFRDGSRQFLSSLPKPLRSKAMPGSQKGLEFSWGRIDENDISILFRAVVVLAGRDQ